jgi:hypothetical protein
VVESALLIALTYEYKLLHFSKLHDIPLTQYFRISTMVGELSLPPNFPPSLRLKVQHPNARSRARSSRCRLL